MLNIPSIYKYTFKNNALYNSFMDVKYWACDRHLVYINFIFEEQKWGQKRGVNKQKQKRGKENKERKGKKKKNKGRKITQFSKFLAQSILKCESFFFSTHYFLFSCGKHKISSKH